MAGKVTGGIRVVGPRGVLDERGYKGSGEETRKRVSTPLHASPRGEGVWERIYPTKATINARFDHERWRISTSVMGTAV